MTYRLSGAFAFLLISGVFALAQPAAPPANAPPGAAACSGCHANSKTVETPVARLQGASVSDIASAMQAFKTGARPATIMDRISRGFSDSESQAIANWYAAQKD